MPMAKNVILTSASTIIGILILIIDDQGSRIKDQISHSKKMKRILSECQCQLDTNTILYVTNTTATMLNLHIENVNYIHSFLWKKQHIGNGTQGRNKKN